MNRSQSARALALSILTLALGTPAVAQEPAGKKEVAPSDDRVFDALEHEIERAMTLSMEDLDRPYYCSAFLTDDDSFSASGSFGALSGSGGGKSASLSVNVRVGTPTFDNTNYSSFNFFGGLGSPTPAEANYDALRQALWMRFDSEYKSAAMGISKKRAYLAANKVKTQLPDFSDAKVETLILPRAALDIDRERWTAAVKRVSAVFRDYPDVYFCNVSLSASAAHQYFVSTDPSRHRFPFANCSLSISASTQCDDGMSVSSSWSRTTSKASQLPADEELIQIARTVAEQLVEMKNAPTAEDYWGPVLFTGDAAAEFFLKTVVDPLSHCRQELGSSSGGRLVDRMGRRIAAPTLTVRDDPTAKEWNGQPLLGHYPIDDDGVLPRAITLIDKGFLKTHYMSRVPTKYETVSNGHSRGGDGSAGNVFVEAAETVPLVELEKKLLELAKREGLDYALVVERMGSSGGGFSFSFGGSTGVSLPAPAYCYRLYHDGRREVIRGGSFLQASFRVLRDIVALGDDAQVTNTRQFGQLISVVAPSVLIEELELKRPREEFSKPPYSDRPEMGTK